MDILIKISLGIHILSGFLALLTGLISIVVKKGGKLHRNAGKIFFYSMIGVTATALFISIVKNNQFLLLIAIFSFYLNYFGFRAIKNKSLKPDKLDWLVLIAGAINAVFMIYSMNIVLMVFAGISVFNVIGNFRVNIQVARGEELPALSWLKRHIGMMIGSYIATVTAFIVVNSSIFEGLGLPDFLPWLLPSLILAPLIAYYTKKYTGKRSSKEAVV